MPTRSRTHELLLSLAAVATLSLLGACGPDFRPAIASINPLNGATVVDQTFKPELRLAESAEAALEEGDRRLVLYDVTNGGRKTIAGSILIEDNRLTYEPNEPLGQDRLYELVLQREAVSGEKLLDVDGSEWPEEPLVWPFRARFATFSLPRVRAVYLDDEHLLPRLMVRFSQRMDQVSTSDQFVLVDQLGNQLALSRPVWIDDSSVRLDIEAQLDPAGLYTLEIGAGTQAADGVGLDGDEDGTPGEAKDSFTIKFTGSEKIIRSRLVEQADS